MQDAPSLGLALLGGVISFLSPCVLPLLPSYLGALGGGERPWPRALGFILGFSLVFMILGASASLLGQWLLSSRSWLNPAAGLFIMAFGVFMLGIIRIPLLLQDTRQNLSRAAHYGPIVLGAAFAFGWSPCIGPILGSILSLAASHQQLSQGVLLLATYALGLAIPFLLATLLWHKINLRWLNRYTIYIEKAGGVLLIVVGALMFTGQFSRLSSALLGIMPAWLVQWL